MLTTTGCTYTGAHDVENQLLDAAARLYAEAGYRGATTRRIAGEAGVNEITLFRHFGSKDALIREAITRAGLSAVTELLPQIPRDPFREVRDWARAHIAELRERRSLIRTCMGEIEEHPGMFSEAEQSTRRGSQGPRATISAVFGNLAWPRLSSMRRLRRPC